MTFELPLQKCPDRKATISFTIKTMLKGELNNNSNRFIAGLMPDIVGGIQQHVQNLNVPNDDGFNKTKVLPQTNNVNNNFQLQVPVVSAIAQPQHQLQLQQQ